ncbi:MAG: hypothetical protein ABI843_08270 [Dokdonella sp.]
MLSRLLEHIDGNTPVTPILFAFKRKPDSSDDGLGWGAFLDPLKITVEAGSA